MQSITVQSHVGEDGILRLQIPVSVKDADLEVTVNFQLPSQNGTAKSPEGLGWSPGFFEETYGCLKDDPIERPPQGDDGEKIATEVSQSIDEIEAIAQSNGWPPGYFRAVVGAWQGEPPERPPQGVYEVRDEFP